MDYTELMTKLMSLPNDIADQEQRVNELRQQVKEAKSDLDARETLIISSRIAKEWGANADERKINQARAFLADVTWQRLISAVAGLDAEIAHTETEVNRLKNMFYAVRTAADLTAAFKLAGRSIVSNGNALDRAAKHGL